MVLSINVVLMLNKITVNLIWVILFIDMNIYV